jgi:hypothetical protein
VDLSIAFSFDPVSPKPFYSGQTAAPFHRQNSVRTCGIAPKTEVAALAVKAWEYGEWYD